MRRTLLATATLAILTSVAACGGEPAPESSTPGEGMLGTSDPTATPSTPSTPATSAPTGGGGGEEDCYTYDPQVLIHNYEAGVHVIRVDHGNEIVRVYGGPADPVGAAALAVATRFETVCYIGRGNSLGSPTYVFEYWKGPSGMTHPEEPAGLFSECVDYAPSDLAVSTNPSGPGWVVRAGGNVLQRFASEADANAALGVMSKEGQICYILTETPAPENASANITFTINTGD